jgi:hypothetical protein
MGVIYPTYRSKFMTKWVTVNSTSAEKVVYHTKKDCPVLSDDVRVVHPSEIEYHNLRECKYCTGDHWSENDGGSTELHDKLLDASPDEVGE